MSVASLAYTSANALSFTLWPAQGTHRSRPASSVQPLDPGNVQPQLALLGPIAPGWEITQPLLVTLEADEDNCYIVSDDQFSVYGDGDSLADALQDYIVSLVDYYELLATRTADDLATSDLFHRLQSYLHPTT